MNLNLSDFLSLQCSNLSGAKTFLLDTQADISLIKHNSVDEDVFVNNRNLINIKGIAHDVIETHGTIQTEFLIDGRAISHELHVVPNDFRIPSDGIIGRDFIKEYQCVIDYERMTLSFFLNNHVCTLPIFDGPRDHTIAIPPRSQVYRIFHIDNFHKPQFVDQSEVEPGIFLANSMAISSSPIIKVLNTTDEVRIISNIISKSEDLSNYSIYTIDSVDQNNRERIDALLGYIKNNSPDYVHDDLVPLCSEYSDIFALETDHMTQNNFYEQRLRLTDSKPVYVKNYRLPHTHKDEINRQVDKLIENNLIEPSHSAYNSPLILVPKKSEPGTKKWRMCVDYRMLNKKLIPDKYPLPRIDEILDKLGRAKFFSVLDLFSGFHQIKLNENSRECTAFSTERGIFQWKVLPFGLNVAPNSFSRMMALAFANLPPNQSFLYMDDLIVTGGSKSSHLSNLRNVFEICRRSNLKLNPGKCNFFRPEVTYLGHTCTQNGLLPDKNKTFAIENYPRPHDKDSTRRFAAFLNYYRRFIQNFSEIIQPLNKLTRKNVEFVWTDECENAFQTLKSKLLSPNILQYPDFSKQFIVTVDASNIACGAVLSQINDGNDLPICFISKSFQRGEMNKSTIEKELLAIHFAITYLRPYLYGTKFIVRSDHKPLVFLYNIKNPSSKLTRIRLDLEEYDFEIHYIPGCKNVAADALSRIHIDDIKQTAISGNSVDVLAITRSMSNKTTRNCDLSPRITGQNELNRDENVSNEAPNIYYDNDYKATRKIPSIFCEIITGENDIFGAASLHIMKNKNELISIDISNDVSERIVNHTLLPEAMMSKLQSSAGDLGINLLQWPMHDAIFKYFSCEDVITAGLRILSKLKIVLTKKQMRIRDENERMELMREFHENPTIGGHFGSKQLYAKLRSAYYWPRMTKDIAKFVRNCPKCQINKVRPSSKEGMTITKTPQKPFDVIVIDTIGPFVKSNAGNFYAITMICDLTKYLISVAVENKSAETVAKAIFDNFILIYGPMKTIKTDLGTEYRNQIMQELCKVMKIQHNFSTAYHHQTLGTVERNHRVFNEYLRAYLTDGNWDEHLKHFTFCYNISYNASFNHTYTPFELVFGKKYVLPNELSNSIEPVYNFDNYIKILKYQLQVAHRKTVEFLERAKQRNKLYYDRNANPIQISVNDLVYLRREPYHKHSSIYSGPHQIKSIDGPNITLLIDNKNVTVHKDRVRKS